MSFGEAVSSGFSNYVNFHSRAMRSEYWFWLLFVVIASVVAILADGILGSAPIFYGLTGLGLLLPGIAVSVRRLRDINKDGWNLLWALFPSSGVYICSISTFSPGTLKRTGMGVPPGNRWADSGITPGPGQRSAGGIASGCGVIGLTGTIVAIVLAYGVFLLLFNSGLVGWIAVNRPGNVGGSSP